MKVVVVGLGIQGRKRIAVAGSDVVATIDPVVPEAHYPSIEAVPLNQFDAALVCTPDQTKLGILKYLLAHRKHVLVEKPLLASDADVLRELAELAQQAQVACYTAYNHRFEPALIRLKEALDAGTIGAVHLVRGYYGNGTARDVRASSWKDQGLGVLSDLGSHLLDVVLWFFGEVDSRFEIWSAQRFENRAPDHALFGVSTGRPAFILETSLLSWRNAFRFDLFGERGSLHVQGLCKWGPSRFITRRRTLPSGRPHEEVWTVECPDPTWAMEYDYFKQACARGGRNLEHDRWINGVLSDMAYSVTEAAALR